MKSILLAHSEAIVAAALQRTLCRLGFHVEIVNSSISTHARAKDRRFDLILFDFNHWTTGQTGDALDPEHASSACWQGTGLIRELRAAGVRTPILVYTALDRELYETASLDAGADDYIIRGPHLATFLSRIHAHLRRREWDLGLSSRTDRRVAIGRYVLDRDTGILFIDDKPVVLTNREMRLIEKLAANPSRIVCHTELLDDLWGNDLRRSPEALAAAVKRLRGKAEKQGAAKLIENIRGKGYKLSNSINRKSSLIPVPSARRS